MTTKKVLAALFALVLAPLANAVPIAGAWEGTWTQAGGVGGTVVMTITDQTPGASSDALIGYFDWQCTFGNVCSGRELFTGTLTDAFFDVTGFALQNSVGLGLSRDFGLLSLDAQSIAGSFSPAGIPLVVGTWTVNRVSDPAPAPVPEPSSIALLGLGLGMLAFAVRRSRQAPR